MRNGFNYCRVEYGELAYPDEDVYSAVDFNSIISEFATHAPDFYALGLLNGAPEEKTIYFDDAGGIVDGIVASCYGDSSVIGVESDGESLLGLEEGDLVITEGYGYIKRNDEGEWSSVSGDDPLVYLELLNSGSLVAVTYRDGDTTRLGFELKIEEWEASEVEALFL